MTLDPEHDVIVVGANVAGVSTARELALRGLDVALVESQPAPDVGSRSCGDGIEVFQFKKVGIPIPQGDFILREVPVAYLLSPDRQTRFRGMSAGITIDRFTLNQHLLSEAIDSGVQLYGSTDATAPVVKDGRVTGIRTRDRASRDTGTVVAPVTVDASGWRGKLRRSVPPDWPIAEVVPDHETAIAYREERRRPEPVEDLHVEATFDFDIAPKGLYWYADRTDVLVNVGVGMQRVPGVPGPKAVIRDRVLPLYPDLKGTALIRSGGGVIPNRRALDCPVADGMVAVGDAACQVNPLSGSGIGSSMFAAALIGRTVAIALEASRSPRTEDLFPYAHAYQTAYGTDQAAYHVLRASLQGLTNAQLNRLMGSGTISEDDLVEAARTGEMNLSFTAKVKAASKLMGEPRLIRSLARLHKNMQEARHLYSEYPESVEGLDAWRRRAAQLFEGI
ncbi:MAG: NAD(P)/FAD-dependent oxidoreductase [Thermoplasmata archaeon]|nr:MAG: NAD(P)/FAD-dependent oxidoreductase [Thermoplasmata archaeon]